MRNPASCQQLIIVTHYAYHVRGDVAFYDEVLFPIFFFVYFFNALGWRSSILIVF